MTKNEGSLTVSVLDSDGNIVGMTYPKRAKGLVKKGRAQYVSDNEIRLEQTDPTCENTEDLKMDNIQNTKTTKNYILFNPKKWQIHPDVPNSKAERFFINSPLDESLTEVYSLGNWGWDWSEITGGMMTLEKNTEYHFVFWLNGGENDRDDETCQCHIMFGNNSFSIEKENWERKLVYKLNRSYIKPVKRYKGWLLFDIPFVTEDKDYTQIRFVACGAPTAIMAASEPETYAELEDVVDEFADKRPQRHNIVFEDGWPTNTWYSTSRLKNGGKTESNFSGFDFGDENAFNVNSGAISNAIAGMISSELMNIKDEIRDEIDIDDIAEEIKNEIIEKIKSEINPSENR